LLRCSCCNRRFSKLRAAAFSMKDANELTEVPHGGRSLPLPPCLPAHAFQFLTFNARFVCAARQARHSKPATILSPTSGCWASSQTGPLTKTSTT
jgi:hypothetical protein